MLSCRDATELCSREQEAPLAWSVRLGLRSHLLMCRSCNRYRQQLDVLRQAMRQYADGQAIGEGPDTGGNGGQGGTPDGRR